MDNPFGMKTVCLLFIMVVLGSRVCAATVQFVTELSEQPKSKIELVTASALDSTHQEDRALAQRLEDYLRELGIPTAKKEEARFLCTVSIGARKDGGDVECWLALFEITQIGPCANPFWGAMIKISPEQFKKNERSVLVAVLHHIGQQFRGAIEVPSE